MTEFDRLKAMKDAITAKQPATPSAIEGTEDNWQRMVRLLRDPRATNGRPDILHDAATMIERLVGYVEQAKRSSVENSESESSVRGVLMALCHEMKRHFVMKQPLDEGYISEVCAQADKLLAAQPTTGDMAPRCSFCGKYHLPMAGCSPDAPSTVAPSIDLKWYRDKFDDIEDDARVLLIHAPKELHGMIDGIRIVAEQSRNALDAISQSTSSCNKCGGLGYIQMTDGLGQGSRLLCECAKRSSATKERGE